MSQLYCALSKCSISFLIFSPLPGGAQLWELHAPPTLFLHLPPLPPVLPIPSRVRVGTSGMRGRAPPPPLDPFKKGMHIFRIRREEGRESAGEKEPLHPSSTSEARNALLLLPFLSPPIQSPEKSPAANGVRFPSFDPVLFLLLYQYFFPGKGKMMYGPKCKSFLLGKFHGPC